MSLRPHLPVDALPRDLTPPDESVPLGTLSEAWVTRAGRTRRIEGLRAADVRPRSPQAGEGARPPRAGNPAVMTTAVDPAVMNVFRKPGSRPGVGSLLGRGVGTRAQAARGPDGMRVGAGGSRLKEH